MNRKILKSVGWSAAIITALLLYLSPVQNWAATLFSLSMLLGIIALLGTSVLFRAALFACTFQWLQASTEVFRANFAGINLNEIAAFPYLSEACALSSFSILVFAAGIRVSCRGSRQSRASLDKLLALSPNRIAAAYFLFFGLALLRPFLAGSLPGLSQLFLVLDVIKEGMLLLLAVTVFTTKKGFKILLVASLFSIVTGLVSYFSTFKFAFYWLILALGIAPTLMKQFRKTILLSFLFSVTLASGLYWTAIKPEYRLFLSQGAKAQVVEVSWQDSLSFLSQLVFDTTQEDLIDSTDALAARIGYTRYFAIVMDREKKNLNPEGPLIWEQAVVHVLMPRLIYPNKPILDDSAQTNRYTGLGVAGTKQGTTISLGYLAESYIDFGPVGMFIPVFLLGCLYGKALQSLTSSKIPQPIGFMFASVILVTNGDLIATSAAKHLGGLIVVYISSWMVLRLWGQQLLIRLHIPTKPRISSPTLVNNFHR